MSVELRHHSLVSSSSSNTWPSVRPVKNYCFHGKVVGLDHLLLTRRHSRKRCRIKLSLLKDGNLSLRHIWLDFRKHRINSQKTRKAEYTLPFASADDGVTINGSPRPNTSSEVEQMKIALDPPLQTEYYSTGLVQSLHDAARAFELAIKEQSSQSKLSWFSTAWLGVDKTAWAKVLSYQASVYSLLQAAIQISSRGNESDTGVNVFVQRSLLRQFALLETVIKEKLSAKQPETHDWFWSEQIPAVVSSFVNYFEKDQRFAAATTVGSKGTSLVTGSGSDISLLMLALSCNAAITKLGATRVSCSQLFSNITDTLGRLMDMLVEFVPMRQAYHSMKDIGLRREFLVHYGPRATECIVGTDLSTEEEIFWLDLIQKKLKRAIHRERIWSKLTTSESIEVLERDLAIFGFFIALGRSTQSFLSANGFDDVDEPIEGFVRYLIGGSVLYYPQLSSISSYQLYVEVVCEELDWLPFYPGNNTPKHAVEHKSKPAGTPNAEAIPIALDICSHWIQSFIKYSKWLENPSNIKAATFLSKGHDIIKKCMEEGGREKNQMVDISAKESSERSRLGAYSQPVSGTDSFDKALENVEEVLIRLEGLLQELHVSSSGSRKEHLEAACSDLEKIRRLKKEAEFLEASFRAKAASFQQGDDLSRSPSSIIEEQQYSGGEESSRSEDSRGWWSFLSRRSTKLADPVPMADGEEAIVSAGAECTESNNIRRFELLRNELVELEKRVQKSTDSSEYDEEEMQIGADSPTYTNETEGVRLVRVQKKENLIGKSLDKLKETSTDVLQGTQLLAIDVAAALGLLRRIVIGDELTEKEKQSLRRTLTDLASVVPIGFLMLLPVTAVGHAAILAAIQRYVPALIPSTYGPERLDLLRQLEKIKEMETEVKPTENADE